MLELNVKVKQSQTELASQAIVGKVPPYKVNGGGPQPVPHKLLRLVKHKAKVKLKKNTNFIFITSFTIRYPCSTHSTVTCNSCILSAGHILHICTI